MHSHIDFGYGWIWSYGHLIPAVIAAALFGLGWAREWPKVLLTIFGAVALWSATAFLIVRFGMNINGRTTLPTQSFLASGSGKVLDMGAGTGRSTLMVLEARPKSFVVALDRFGPEYVAHFGDATDGKSIPDEGRERLLHNLKIAGVDQRAAIQAGDMRQMPFEAATFDAIVSAYAIDHLNREGIRQSLREAARVLKPSGDFLLMVIAKDVWLEYAFGPLLLHTRRVAPDFWQQSLHDAGFEVVEQGSRIATQYILARRRA